MPEKRELQLVKDGSPCDTNFFDRTLLTIGQARSRGRDYCPNISECRRNPHYCVLQYGAKVARYVMEGGDLKSELLEFSEEPHTSEPYWDSVDRKNFKIVEGKARVIKAVERFAKVVLLENSEHFVFNECSKCGGVKLETTVIDSARDGVFAFSGSGRTRKRLVIYCPTCDPKPKNGTFEESLNDLF